MNLPKCAIDADILNKKTLPDMKDIALSLFASACGKNRGAFVLDPPDGNTYSCLNLPGNFPDLAGATHLQDDVVIANANDIQEQFLDQNITASDAVKMLDYLIQSVYHSTPSKETSPYACEFSGLAELGCSGFRRSPRTDGFPIRSVTLAGIFVPAPWATNGKELSLNEAEEWYTLDDFVSMKSMGLNTVQISVPTAAFTAKDMHGAREREVLEGLLDDIAAAELDVILALVSTADEEDAVVAACKFASEMPVVLGVTLPPKTTLDTKTLISAIRVEASYLPIFVPLKEGDLIKANGEFDPNVYGSLELSHSATVADVASSTSQEDRSKLFYHESIACMNRSPLEFASCFQQMPTFLSYGFDLSVDDCINQYISDDFKDYGQCDRFDETIYSGWWARHRQSFAARQLFAYERGLGWSFSTWKLYKNDNVGVIDNPSKLLSLQDVAAAGLFPDLSETMPASSACLNPPDQDFVLGDDTLAPTQGPPPDCGDGWWNYTTEKCDYWIPPDEPTASCPTCEICPSHSTSSLAGAAVGGAIVAGLVSLAFLKYCYGDRSDYMRIPNVERHP